MKTLETTIYICEHCNKVYRVKSACIKHENVCRKNPDNIPACYSCKYFSIEDRVYEGLHSDDPYTTMYCSKMDLDMMPITSHKRGVSSWFSGNEVVTPKDCDDFKLYGTE